MNKNAVVKLTGLFLLGTVCCMAQSSPFGGAARGVATEMVAIVRWVAIILCIICGFGIAAGGSHMAGKIGGLLVGLAFAIFASPIVTWFQGLSG